MISLQCISCIHYRMAGQCDAYPGRIPYEIISGQIDHKKPYLGDNGIMFESGEKIIKLEIPIDLLKSRQKRKAWVVRYANGYAVQCFEDEADADYFIETSKEKDAGWFDFNNRVYREVKSGWDIHKKGTRITFETDGEDK